MNFLNNRTYTCTKPKGFLNCLRECVKQTGVLLDEQFKFVSNGSGAEQVGDDQQLKIHTQTASISKNGYLYVFVSNETPNINVFFDNLQAVSADRSVCITHLKGPLLEESHYYPFGTEMSGISSHSLPSFVPNRYKANAGAEFGDEEWANSTGLEMYETFYRSYNAQIGRFMQGDPKMEATISMSGYVFSGNNPVMFTDLLGDQYKYMDKMGNRWHHADVLEGTALEGQQYIEGFGLDGFGDSWIGDVQNGGGGGGKSGSTTDYTSQWEDIVAGFNSGKGDSWSPGYGFYDGSLYPAGVNWVKLREVVVNGYQKPTINIPYYFSKSAFLYSEGVGYRGWFEIKGNINVTKYSDGKYKVGVSMGAYSPANPGTPNGIGGASIEYYGTLKIQSENGRILRSIDVSTEKTIFPNLRPDDDRTYFNYESFEFSVSSSDHLKVFFNITYVYLSQSGGATPLNNIIPSSGQAFIRQSVPIN